jgi:hypothetical protein
LADRRDEFTSTTRIKLAKQVGWHCSKPGCFRPTVGPTADGEGEIMLGRAAHITAAASGGPRFDARLTAEERKSKANGIWLCTDCATLIDEDASAYPESKIREWKRLAQKRARLELLAHGSATTGLSLGAEELAEVLEPVTRAAVERLDSLRRLVTWPPHPIPLGLSLILDKEIHPLSLETVAGVTDTYEDLALVASPGMGKTTTMVQIATAITDRRSAIAAVILLAEWATGSEGLFQSLHQQAGFRDVPLNYIELMAKCGRLVLLLDGWNELDDEARRKTRAQINSLKREHPDLQFIVSSRHQEPDLPVSGPTISLNALSHGQQLEIATAFRQEEGRALLDHAWRTPGLRELIEMPLYLRVLMEQVPGTKLPTTKDELLAAFAARHEENPEHLPTLRAELHGLHAPFLSAIARTATDAQTTALPTDAATVAIVAEQKRLISEQLQSAPIPALRVLDVLARAHLITLHAGNSVGFHHQQFQEWYASHWAERLVLDSYSGNPEATRLLREAVLDVPAWEESVLFACERLTRRDRVGCEAVAAAIILTLAIDPVFAAEMIFRSSPEAWDIVRDDAVRFARRWRALVPDSAATDFMVATGKPEFADDLWPVIIDDKDDQRTYEILRSGHRFRPSVLGPDIGHRIEPLSDTHRARVLSEVAHNSGMDGLELATTLATTDGSDEVKIAVADALAFRSAMRLLERLLANASDAVWNHLARKWRPEDFDAAAMVERIAREAARLVTEGDDPVARLYRLARLKPTTETAARVESLVGEIDFGKRDESGWPSIHEVTEAFPAAVARGLLRHLERGEAVPYGAEELLRASDIVLDDGPAIDRLLGDPANREAAKAVTLAGPRVVGALIDQLMVVDVALSNQAEARRNGGKYDQSIGEEHHRLIGLIGQSRSEALAQGILDRSDSQEPTAIGTLATLVSRHGRDVPREVMSLQPKTLEALQSALISWSGRLLSSPTTTREQLSEVAQAMTRVPSERCLDALAVLLAEDLRRLTAAYEERSQAIRDRRPPSQTAHIHWNTQYARALMAISGERVAALMLTYLEHPIFGADAAHTLAFIATGPEPREDSAPIRSGPDFEKAHDNYFRRQRGEFRETHRFVDRVLDAAQALCASGDSRTIARGLEIASVAIQMPFADRRARIDWFLGLNVPAAQKQRLMTMMMLAGEVVPADLVSLGIDQLIEDAKTRHWMLDQDGWRIMEWLQLVPFSGDPAVFLANLDRFEERLVPIYNLHGPLSALGYSPSAEAESILFELARRHPESLSDYHWRSAVAKRGSEAMGMLLLDLIEVAVANGKKGERAELPEQLAYIAERHDRFRDALHRRFLTTPVGPARNILERAIAEDTSESGVLVLLRAAATENRPYRATALHRAIESALISQRPSENFRGMQEMFSRPTGPLRRALFDIALSGNPTEVALAKACLEAIDELRDRYGSVETDRRHPNIASGRPWPLLDS